MADKAGGHKHHSHHAKGDGMHKNDKTFQAEKRSRAHEAAQEALLKSAQKGDFQVVMQYIFNEKNPVNHLLLHSCLRFKNLTEAQFLAVLRWDPLAAETEGDQGWYPLHILAYMTARPTTTMIRALTQLFPLAARRPMESGWLPLQLLCQNPRNKGDNSHHGVRATAAVIAALRASYPNASMEFLPQATENGLGEKRAEHLLPFNLHHREHAVAALNLSARDVCEKDEHDRFEADRLKGELKFEADRACDAGSADGVLDVLKKVHGHYSGITDVVDKDRGRMLFHRCCERCGDSLEDRSFDFLARASPSAPFLVDFQRLLPIHILLATAPCTTPHMIKRLVAIHPKSLTHRGTRGWTPIHFFCMRLPTYPRAVMVLHMLLDTKLGRKALRMKDDKGDLPLHLFCVACADLRDQVDHEIATGLVPQNAATRRGRS